MRPENKSRHRHYFVLAFVCVIFLSCDLSPGQQADKKTSPLPETPKPSVPEAKGFFARWAEFYRQDWSGTAASSPAPARRGLPSPLDSPPFPNSDWSYGGSPVIGEPDTNSYPLMTAINQARSRTKLYGWIDPTLNFSTSAHSNAPEANDVYSNRFRDEPIRSLRRAAAGFRATRSHRLGLPSHGSLRHGLSLHDRRRAT